MDASTEINREEVKLDVTFFHLIYEIRIDLSARLLNQYLYAKTRIHDTEFVFI